MGRAAHLTVLTLAIALSTISCAPSPTFTLESITSPASFAGSSPQLTSAHGRVLLSWLDSSGDRVSLRFAERSASGWSDPQTVASHPDLLVNSADVPSVRALADGSLAAHWMVDRRTGPEAYDLRIAWSPDSGRSWSDPVLPHHDDTDAQHGFVSLFEPDDGRLGLVWLDGRAIQTTASGTGGDMALRATGFDATHRQEDEAVVDPRVCECCPTSATESSEGVLVAYRGRSQANVRDIQVARLADSRWSAPVTVHDDGWTLSACPVNGPSIDANGTRVVVGWFTLQEAQGRAFVAFSADAGRTFGPPIRVDDSSARGRLQVALLDDDSAAVTWIEYADRVSQLRLRRVHRDGSRSESLTIAGGMGTQHPRMVRLDEELILAWVESGDADSEIRTASVALQPSF